MEAHILNQSDYLDIVYYNRNKSYGGYQLRRTYSDRMKKAGLATLVFISSLGLAGFVSSKIKHEASVVENRNACNFTEVKLPEVAKPVVPPRPAAAPPPPASATQRFTVPKITNEEIKPDETMARQDELTHAAPGLRNAQGDSASTIGIGDVSGGTSKEAIVVTPTLEIPTFVEIMPSFNGDLNAYLSSHIQYPEAARSAGIEGRVGVQFIVNEDGSISDLKITRSIGGGCDEEAMRVIASMPKWKPGRNNGRACKVYFTQPISFRLQ